MAVNDFPRTKARGLDLLREVMDQIERDQSRWDQGRWTKVDTRIEQLEHVRTVDLGETIRSDYVAGCGTAMCLAGHACLMAGDRPLVQHFHMMEGAVINDALMSDTVRDAEGVSHYIPARAIDLLGITAESADILFSARNTLDDLREMVDTLTGGGKLEDVDKWEGRFSL